MLDVLPPILKGKIDTNLLSGEFSEGLRLSFCEVIEGHLKLRDAC